MSEYQHLVDGNPKRRSANLLSGSYSLKLHLQGPESESPTMRVSGWNVGDALSGGQSM